MQRKSSYANLEIRILKREAAGYPIELTLDGNQEFQGGYLQPNILPWVPGASPTADGERLFNLLFADQHLQQQWAEIRGQSPQRRVRLRLDANAPELHTIPWELLRDTSPDHAPQTLAAAVATPFSRYLAGNWRPSPPIHRRPIKILLAIANPANLADFNLAPLDIATEWGLLQTATRDLAVELIQLPQPCTLSAIAEGLKEGCHILHLVGHGAYSQRRGQAQLYLADDQNQVELISEAEFAAMLTRQMADTTEFPLRLVFLASCQSAVRSPADAFRGLAPQLIEAGVPAVLAMQDLIPVETMHAFTGTFYRQLFQHGQVDLASNEARDLLMTGDYPGSSVPVLFSRLPDNQLFISPEDAAPLPVPPAEAQERRDLGILLHKVKTFWIEGVLEKSVPAAVLLDLGKQVDFEAVDDPWERVLELPGQDQQSLPPHKAIGDIFDDMNRALLILGEPGSGKTITLLELARDLIRRVEADPSFSQPLPVVFNLSSWARGERLIDWLVDELSAKYQIPKRIGRPWLENNRLLPLLDGLDEVKTEDQAACVEAINQFSQEFGLAGLAVCSRLQEYRALPVRLKLNGAIRLQALSPGQVNSYLAAAGPKLDTLRTALQQDQSLQTLAQSPLILNVMSLAYQEEAALTGQALDSVEARHKHLFDTYIERMFSRKGKADKPYTDRQTTAWLAWLAQNMTRHNQAIFLIERMQPSWLLTRRQRWAYFLSSRAIQGALIGLLAGLGFGLIDEMYFSFLPLSNWLITRLSLELAGDLSVQLRAGMLGGLLVGLLIGLMVGLFDALRFEQNDPSGEAEKTTLRETIGNVLSFGLLSGLLGALLGEPSLSAGLIFGLSFGLIFGIRGSRQSISNDIQTVEALRLSWANVLKGGAVSLLFGLLFGVLVGLLVGLLGSLFFGTVFSLGLARGLFYGLGMGLSIGLAGAIYSGLNTRVVETSIAPNQGIRLSLKNAILTGLLVGLLFGLTFGLVYGLLFEWGLGLSIGLIVGLSFGLFATLWYGNFDLIQHYILRLILWTKDYAPPRYVHFLDYAAEQVFLQKVGGGYIFIHRLLLEHFATLAPEPATIKPLKPIFNLSWPRLARLCLLVGILLTAIVTGRLASRYLYLQKLIGESEQLARAGQIEAALANSAQIRQLNPDLDTLARVSNNLCWFGSLGGHPAEVMDACERAVALAPDNGGYRDSRGLARALLGDYQGAIADFQFYVTWSQQHAQDQYERYGLRREAWIDQLKAGQNPFDSATLAELRDE